MNPARKSLQEKAPLIDFDELEDLIVNEMLSDNIKQEAESAWITSSFVDPDREIDTSQYPSDLDVQVVIPGWEYPIADSGIAFFAPQVETPDIYKQAIENAQWDSKDEGWATAEEAWEELPEYARETLLNSIQFAFRADENDIEEDRIRQYDISIIDEEYRRQTTKPGAEICVWRRDEE